jgi:CBS domain containing-hemolysin-like protein
MILVSCLAGCYFAACHTALRTFSRKRLSDLMEQRGQASRLERYWPRLSQLSLTSGVLRALFSLAVVLLTLYYVDWRFDFWEKPWRYLLAFGIAGGLVSVFTVAIPVSWARYQRERLLAWSLPVLSVCRWLLWPVIVVLQAIDPIVRRLSGVDLMPEEENAITDEVLSVVEEHEGGSSVDDAQKEMLEAVFDLPSTTAGGIMTPRTDIRGIEVNTPLGEVLDAIQQFGHSRIPVYDDNMDNIVGILYAKDLIPYVGHTDTENFDLRQTVREAYMVPESKSVRDLLGEFKARKVHIAIILDEYGGTAGLVTIEDILEEIVGEIQDEYEPQDELPHLGWVDENTAEVDARMHIDDFNDELEANLSEDEDYDTIGGFVFATLGHIPEEGESFEWDGLRFTVTEAERTKIRKLRLEKLSPKVAASEENGG